MSRRAKCFVLDRLPTCRAFACSHLLNSPCVHQLSSIFFIFLSRILIASHLVLPSSHTHTPHSQRFILDHSPLFGSLSCNLVPKRDRGNQGIQQKLGQVAKIKQTCSCTPCSPLHCIVLHSHCTAHTHTHKRVTIRESPTS